MKDKIKTMVEILESEIELNSDELAERLGVTPRTIGNYKKILISMGYKIQGKAGRCGGYKIYT